MSGRDSSKQDHASRPDEILPREWRSEQLFQGTREVVILHNQERYRLLVTRSGKLILQK